MNTASMLERQIERIAAGERLPAGVLEELEAGSDILSLGMLADAARRRVRGGDVTYLRVAARGLDSPETGVPAGAREIRLTGAPPTLDAAMDAVARARTLAGERTLSGFAWTEVAQLGPRPAVLRALREAGLDAIAHVALDMEGGARAALEQLAETGYQRLRVGIDQSPRVELFRDLAAFQDRFACVQAVAPLPRQAEATRPTTGYQNVRAVAFARLAAPNVPTVQVDWQRYGPKLAQVALTFGADDLDWVSPSDDAPEGPRRAPLEDVRRNVEAAGLIAVERDGRFNVVV